MADDNEIFDFFSEQDAYSKIVSYIANKFQFNLSTSELKDIAKYLMKIKGLGLNSILAGEEDNVIVSYLSAYEARRSSVKQEKEDGVVLKVKKKNVAKPVIVASLTTAIMIGGIFGYISYSEIKEDKKVSENIGVIAGAPSDNDIKSIVKRNTIKVASSKVDGHDEYAYQTDKIALEIISVCTKDPKLFDICIYNVYSEMEYSRLQTMDKIFQLLKTYLSQDEKLKDIYNKIKDCDVFYDYLLARGFANPNDKHYYDLVQDIVNYSSLSLAGIENPFNNLPEESQKRLVELLNIYSKNRGVLYAEYSDDLESLASESQKPDGFGGR